ncbi:MAG: ferritin family protein [Nitrospirota bacterium]|jgi:rubrerythrin
MNAIEISIKMETDAIAYYSEAAAKTEHPVGKKMFLSIIEDEKRHLKMLEDIFKGLDIKIKDVSPLDNVKTVFEKHRDEMSERVPATTNEMDALKEAMNMEKEGIEFYTKAAKEAKTAKEKALFERLAQEEKQHYQVFSNTYFFMSDTGSWFMWEEHSIVDGGTPTA